MIVMYAEFFREKEDKSPVKIEYRDIINADATLKDRADMVMPSYGLISNDATLEFRINKINREVIYIANEYNRPFCVMYLVNTISGKSQKMSTKYITDISVDENEKTASIRMTDNLIMLQKSKRQLSPPSLSHNPLIGGEDESLDTQSGRYTVPKPFAVYFYRYDGSNRNPKLDNTIITERARNIIDNSTAALYYYEQSNEWRHYDELCQALMLHMYINNDDNIVIDFQNGA